ncbi:MAG: membrane protein insertase YidC [Bacteroidales bacterium]|nr:membrane protein insertase YidC [Bacteroidales bacterium]
MNKNSVIGWILIALIFIGFMFYQSKQIEKQQAYQQQLDSIAAVEQLAQWRADSAAAAARALTDTLGAEVLNPEAASAIYTDSLLESASKGEGKLVTLSNSKLELVINTKGAQPHSAKVKDFRNYDSTDLYIFRGGDSRMGLSVYTGQNINTADFVFDVVSSNDSSVVMRLPFGGGGYIEQSYTLKNDSYLVENSLGFIGMENVIPRNVSVMDLDWQVTIPRMEKGYRNESQYSKIDYYFSGEKKVAELGRGRNGSKRIENRLDWIDFQQQFFSALMDPKEDFSSGSLEINFVPENDESHNLMTCTASMRYDFKHSEAVRYNTDFYFGPNDFRILKSYDRGYEKVIPLGGWLVGWFTRYVIIPLFDFLHRGISNFGIIILIMTIIIKLIVSPFTFKSYSSTAKMQAIKPEIDKLNKKFPKPEDAMKKQQATMDLYRKAGINPAGGCLPMLLQFPILWAMFRFFPASIELRQQHFLWAEDLSAYDSIVNFGTRIPLLGDHISLFALLMALSMFFYSKITMQGQTTGDDPNAVSMRFMSLYMMPVMMFFICNSLSSGLSYYYLLSNLFTMLISWIIKKFFVKPEDIQKKLKEAENKPVQKSKWQLRLEEAQKMQQQQLEQQRKARNQARR